MKTAMERFEEILNQSIDHDGQDYIAAYLRMKELAKSFAQELGGRGAGMPTLRWLQDNLPWTIRYSDKFEAEATPMDRVTHDILHVMKSLGRIAAECENHDHGRDRKLYGAALAKEVADFVICALHIAKLQDFDLQDAVIENSSLRNAVDLAGKCKGCEAGFPFSAVREGFHFKEDEYDAHLIPCTKERTVVKPELSYTEILADALDAGWEIKGLYAEVEPPTPEEGK